MTLQGEGIEYPSITLTIILRKAKIVCNFGLSECNRVKMSVTALRSPADCLKL